MWVVEILVYSPAPQGYDNLHVSFELIGSSEKRAQFLN